MNSLLNSATSMARVAVLLLFPVLAGAQSTSPTMADATVLAAGSLRFQGGVEWTRFDAIFGTGGRRLLPLGSLLTTDVDVAVLPALQTAEFAARVLTGSSNVQLVLGTLTTGADSRVATIPLSLEYGLTKRITLGLRVPIVETRTVVTAQLNGKADSSANIGVNPAGFSLSSAAFSANSQVTSGLEAARTQLSQMIVTCTNAPGAAGCPAFNARRAEADALVADASDFSSAAVSLYGVSVDNPGEPFVPLAGSAIQLAVDAHLAAIRAAFTSFNIGSGSGALVPATGVAANDQLRAIISDPRYGISLDSIGSTKQLSLGDIELSAATQLFNSFTDEPQGGVQWRATVAGVVRLGTGRPALANRPFDIGTGDGQTDLEGRFAADIMLRNRLLTTVAATYTAQLGSVAYTRLPYSPDYVLVLDEPVAGSIKPGNMATLRVNPRLLITRGLMVGGLYAFSHRDGDQVTVNGLAPNGAVFGNTFPIRTWSGGLTISYSNLATRNGSPDPTFPAEILFSHLETIGSTTSGPEKAFRDVLELRLYLRARR